MGVRRGEALRSKQEPHLQLEHARRISAGPAVHPYSAENAFESTVISWMAPIGTVAIIVWRPQPSSLFAPSSVTVVVRDLGIADDRTALIDDDDDHRRRVRGLRTGRRSQGEENKTLNAVHAR